MPEQESLFHDERGALWTGVRLDLPDADVTLLPEFFGSPDRDRLLADIDHLREQLRQGYPQWR